MKVFLKQLARLVFGIMPIFQLPLFGQDLSKIDHYLQSALAEQALRGMSIAIVTRDSTILVKGFGKDGNGQPVTAQTPFAIASLSKAFTATAVLQLAEKGKLDLDKSVKNYLPDLNVNAALTPRQLLNQTGGLQDRHFPELSFYTQPKNLTESMARFKEMHFSEPPGKAFHYHNPNFQILAALVEKVSGLKFPAYLETHIFSRLGMNGTRDFVKTSDFFSSGNLPEGHIGVVAKPVVYREPEWFVEGAAGMVSNAEDMAKWLRFQLGGGVFQKDTLLGKTLFTAMRTAPISPESRYGMGLFVNADSSLYHSGILWTYSAEMIFSPKRNYGIIILFNKGLNAYSDYNAVLRGVVEIMEGREPENGSMSAVAMALTVIAVILALWLWVVLKWRKRSASLPSVQKRSVARRAISLILHLLPLIFVLSIPYLLTAVSGRVLNWPRIFLTCPELLISLALLAATLALSGVSKLRLK